MEHLTVITDEISQKFDIALNMASEFGIKGVDIRSVWKKNIALLTNEELEKLKLELEKKEMKIIVITSPFAKCVLPSSILATNKKNSLWRNPEYNLSLFDRMVEISDFFETPYIRIFSFSYKLKKFKEKKWKEMIVLLHPFIEKAEKLGKILLLENDYGLMVSNINQTKRFFEEMNSNSIKLVLDPGNYFMEGEPTTPDAYEYFYKNDLVGHIHVKDPKQMIPGMRAIFTVVGEGKIDYPLLFKQAIDHGYKGYFSLETHVIRNKKEISRKSLKNMSKWLKELN